MLEVKSMWSQPAGRDLFILENLGKFYIKVLFE